MTDNSGLKRGAGVLMPVSALPSPYGIGTLGKESFEFIEFLKEAGFSYWQVLPVGPTSFGDSPYQSFSAFAGNPYFIDLDMLIEEGLLAKEEVVSAEWGEKEDEVDYARIYNARFKVLKKAFHSSRHRESREYSEFLKENEFWLHDYSFYMALKNHFQNREWQLWEQDIAFREKEAVERYEKQLSEEIDFWKFVQYKFKEQWKQVRKFAADNGISIIGDIPLYVSMDSSDVWVHGDLFELDERKKPIHVAGVPPDMFSAEGQRWGNPLYRWDVMEKQDFKWWRERMKSLAALYDVIRVDHFIGIVNYYAIPASCPTAVEGKWEIGPGKKLTDVFTESIGNARIIAEDLGVLTPPVKKLIQETGFAGIKVLEFGLDGPEDNDYLPHNYKTSNLAVYTGTHDNETLVGFLQKKSWKDLEKLLTYFQVTDFRLLPDAIIRAAYASVADAAIIQMQDFLKLDNSARMNFPSTVGGNWKWRFKKEQYQEIDCKKLYCLACLYARAK